MSTAARRGSWRTTSIASLRTFRDSKNCWLRASRATVQAVEAEAEAAAAAEAEAETEAEAEAEAEAVVEAAAAASAVTEVSADDGNGDTDEAFSTVSSLLSGSAVVNDDTKAIFFRGGTGTLFSTTASATPTSVARSTLPR